MHKTSDFNYYLPVNLIAQEPARPRESAKLMVLGRETGTISHHTVARLPTFFKKGDVVVVNNSKVFNARLIGTLDNGKSVELFLIRPTEDNYWLSLGRPGKKFSPGTKITIAPDFVATVVDKRIDGTLLVTFGLPKDGVIKLANTYGQIPTPPYIKKTPKPGEYQTAYAKTVGSVAAPTAGFHLTPTILNQLRDKEIAIVEVTLHVGLGTFLPIKSETLETHSMHSEWVEISENVARVINDAKKNHQRIIAIGTTTVRTLEGVAKLMGGKLAAYSGDIHLFITPGFTFEIVDAMLTNFHLPKSSLIVLVSAFAGKELILRAYNEAIEKKYRFYSFGDAMLIL